MGRVSPLRGGERKTLVAKRKILVIGDLPTLTINTILPPRLEWLSAHGACHRAQGSDVPHSLAQPVHDTLSSWPLSRFGFSLTTFVQYRFLPAAMASQSQRSKGHDGALSALNVAIKLLAVAKDVCGIPPAQVVFGSLSALMIMIRVRFPAFQPRASGSCLSRTL
jgi:hypothetical protein